MVSIPDGNGRMMLLSESREEAQERTRPLVTPKNAFKIGSWNVRTMLAPGKAEQVAREMRRAGIDILGISECRWSGSGRMRLSSGETKIHCGRDDDRHNHGVAIMMSKNSAKSLIDWTPVSERIISARYFSNHVKMTRI